MNDLRKFIDITEAYKGTEDSGPPSQDQRSVRDQLFTLLNLANKNGLYDAADWLKDQMDKMNWIAK